MSQISYHPEFISFPVAVGEALLAFSGRDESRPGVAVGIDDAHLCATDGHTGLRFLECDPGSEWPMARNGTVWSYETVKQAVAVAKARKLDVELPWNAARGDATFPPLHKAMPQAGFSVETTGHVGLNPDYLARIAKVAKCWPRSKKRPPREAMLIACRGPLDPVLWQLHGQTARGVMLTAEVCIMPVRCEPHLESRQTRQGASQAA